MFDLRETVDEITHNGLVNVINLDARRKKKVNF